MNHNQLLTLRVNNKLLRENVDIEPLIPELLADKIIREEHVSIVQRGTTRQEKAKLFFEDLLFKKGYGGYWSVIKGLRKSNQADIAEILENTICDSTGDIPRDRRRKHRRIILRPVRKPESDEATTASEERVINYLLKQFQSVDPSSLREHLLQRYNFLVEHIEPIPVCIVVLPRKQEKLRQFDHDVASGTLKRYVMRTLQTRTDFAQYSRAWDLDVTVQREQLPSVAQQDDDESEEEDAPAELLSRGNGGSGGRLVTDSGPRTGSGSGSSSPEGSLEADGASPANIQLSAPEDMDSGPRDSIAHNVMQMYVRSSDYTAKDFFQLITSSVKKGVNVMGLQRLDDQGFSVLHEVVDRDRGDLVVVFYDTGLLNDLYRLRVNKRSSQYEDMTPIAMAEQYRKKCKDELEFFIQKDKKLTKLCRYARRGDFSKVQNLVQKKTEDVHYMSEGDGTYPVFWACVANNKRCVDFLVESGAHLDVVTKDGERILTKVTSLGHCDLVQYLLEHYKLDPNQKGLHKKAPLERAAETGDSQMFNILWRHGAKIEGSTILHSAARAGQVRFLKKILEEHGQKVDVNAPDEAQRTPIHHAADNAHVSALQTLLSYGADITKQDIRRRNVLHFLADSYCTDGTELILNLAESHHQVETIINQQELYLGGEQCFLVRGRDKGQYAWHYVIVDRGLLTVFKMVINRGQVDVGRYGKIIMSGWGLAPPQETVDDIAKRYDPTIVREGIKPDMTPLHYSIIRENDALTDKLIQSGASVNVKDSFGYTPLHLAAMRGQLFIVKRLEAKGANVDARDNKNRTAQEIADLNRQKHVANYLKGIQDINKCRVFVDTDLPNIKNELDFRVLQNMRNGGQDVRLHVIHKLRDLESKIHDLLYEVGTTPVMQPTADPQGSMDSTAQPEQVLRAVPRTGGTGIAGSGSGGTDPAPAPPGQQQALGAAAAPGGNMPGPVQRD